MAWLPLHQHLDELFKHCWTVQATMQTSCYMQHTAYHCSTLYGSKAVFYTTTGTSVYHRACSMDYI